MSSNEDLPPGDSKNPQNWQETFKGKEPSQFRDPCQAAARASMECLNRHDYDRDKCLDFFKEYRECKAKWILQRRADRRAGRSP